MSKFSVGDIVELDPDVPEEQLAELGLVSQRVFKSTLMEDLREGPWVVIAILNRRFRGGDPPIRGATVK